MPAISDRGEAAIIDISTRKNRPATRGGRKPVSSPTPRPGAGGHGDTPQQQLAEHVETTFNHHQLTLTDEMTATAYAVTLQIVRGMLEGAEAQGIVDGEQRTELDVMIKGMAVAPRLI
jgi:hypothetical protein